MTLQNLLKRKEPLYLHYELPESFNTLLFLQLQIKPRVKFSSISLLPQKTVFCKWFLFQFFAKMSAAGLGIGVWQLQKLTLFPLLFTVCVQAAMPCSCCVNALIAVTYKLIPPK